MQPEEILELTISLPGLADYSRQPWSGNINKELAKGYISKILSRRSDMPFNKEDCSAEDILRYLKIIDKNISNILFGDFPYRIVFYDCSNLIVNQETRHGLFGLLTDSFIDEVQQWSISQTTSAMKPFSDKALREGINNAVAHSAYFENYGEIIIEIFPHKVIISNLCLRESIYFANKWFSSSHKSYNQLLMEILRMAGYVDELGRGKSTIFAESINNGKRPPRIYTEPAGRYFRWKLYIFGGMVDQKQIKLLMRLKSYYKEEQKALIAYALVLWRDKTVSDIRNYVGEETAPIFAEVLGDLNGPVFYYGKNDQILLQRWARIILEEGKDSKAFTTADEEALYDFAFEMQTKYHRSIITPQELRLLAHMGDSESEKVLSSKILKKWVEEKKVTKIKKGEYRFVQKELEKISYATLLSSLLKENKM